MVGFDGWVCWLGLLVGFVEQFSITHDMHMMPNQ